MSSQTATRAIPIRVREFRSASCNVVVKKWEANGDKPVSFFLEVSQRTQAQSADGKSVWVNLQIQTADTSGVVDQLQRAAAFANALEDQEFRK